MIPALTLELPGEVLFQARHTFDRFDAVKADIAVVTSVVEIGDGPHTYRRWDSDPDRMWCIARESSSAREEILIAWARHERARAEKATTEIGMPIERAREITAACVRHAAGRMGLGEDSPLPDCSLEEMLVANRIMSGDAGKTKGPDGFTTIACVVDPRGIAAAYALQQYQGDPIALIESLGFRFTRGKLKEG